MQFCELYEVFAEHGPWAIYWMSKWIFHRETRTNEQLKMESRRTILTFEFLVPSTAKMYKLPVTGIERGDNEDATIVACDTCRHHRLCFYRGCEYRRPQLLHPHCRLAQCP